jgi:hypothetical protein
MESQANMATGRCAACRFWVKAGPGRAGWKMGMGQCANVLKYYDVSEDSGSGNPTEWNDCSRILKPEFLDVKAVALDASGYRAELLTTGDFGCVSFEPRD